MIIGKNFVWGHIPKTGGDATHAFFHIFPDIIEFSHDCYKEWKQKHHSFREMDVDLTNKMVILNIRKLPNWWVSTEIQKRELHKLPPAALKGWPYVGEKTVEEICEENPGPGDLWINKFTDHGRINIDYWLCCDHLIKDFSNLINLLCEPTRKQLHKIQTITTKPKLKYDHNIHSWFTKAQIEKMYKNNPLWAEIERKTYSKMKIYL